MKPSQILKRAQKLIDAPEKWCKGVYTDAEGRHCVIGAMRQFTWRSMSAYREHRTYLDCTMGPNAAVTNDAPDTEHIHVMMAYDLAILMAQDDERGAKRVRKTAVQRFQHHHSLFLRMI